MSERVEVKKTHKLFIGGAFPRSESGRTFEATDAKGRFLANMAKGSRKDARDAVRAARAAQPGWAARTPYNRGQIVYRVAEIMEDRRDQLVEQLRAVGSTPKQASTTVDLTIDRIVWYAGWADKYVQVLGNANPVSSPFFNLSSPEPTGVVAVLAPDDPLLGLVETTVAAVVTGNTVVAVADLTAPIPAVTFAEILATSDVPGGVVNILTGDAAEIGPWLASHLDVDGIDLAGAGDNATALEVAAAENLKRVRRPADQKWAAEPDLSRLAQWTETKTVWHPIGV